MDFTQQIFTVLLNAIKSQEYKFLTFEEFIKSSNSNERRIVLRHDVDLLPGYALRLAKIEKGLGIKGTYYFRIVPQSFDVEVIQKIAAMGHEIGYHYEDMDLAYRQLKIKNEKLTIDTSMAMPLRMTKTTNNKQQTIIDLAYEMFKKNLAKMREVADIKTICMHGSPLSPYDNKLIWKKYSYKDLGIIGEPYLDIDWNEFGYLTDTGRKWNSTTESIRDKVEGKFKFKFKSTKDIIRDVDSLPNKIMITVHPQRWTDAPLPWVKELVLQNVKNVVKKLIVRRQK